MKAKLLIIILLFPLMANMPVSAQAPTATISLSCPDFEFEYIYNENLSNESPISEVTCIANNPTAYQEKISIQVNTERNITSTVPREIYVGGNQEVEFNVTITDSVGKLNFDFPSNFNNSTTTKSPVTSLLLLFSKLETQFTVPPVANKSSTMA